MTGISRRDFLKITAVVGGVVLGASIVQKDSLGDQISLTETRNLMGTIIHLKVVCHSETLGRNALGATFAEMERLVCLFNWRNTNSQVAILNRNGRIKQASSDLISVVKKALEIGELTGGAFDITIKPVLDSVRSGRTPYDEMALVDYRKIVVAESAIGFSQPDMQVSLDGIAKGFVIDKGVEQLRKLGFEQVMVEAGGDLAVNNNIFQSKEWRVGIVNPRPESLSGYLAAFSITDGAVATSGDYLEWFREDKSLHHIIDPRVGQSPNELASVTIYAPDATTADALATAVMVMGSEAGLNLVNSLDNVEALVVTKSMTIKRTTGFPGSSIG